MSDRDAQSLLALLLLAVLLASCYQPEEIGEDRPPRCECGAR